MFSDLHIPTAAEWNKKYEAEESIQLKWCGHSNSQEFVEYSGFFCFYQYAICNASYENKKAYTVKKYTFSDLKILIIYLR